MIYFLSLLSVVTAFNRRPVRRSVHRPPRRRRDHERDARGVSAADDDSITTVTRSREVRRPPRGLRRRDGRLRLVLRQPHHFQHALRFRQFRLHHRLLGGYRQRQKDAHQPADSLFGASIDVLEFVEGAPAGGAFSSDVWLAIDPDEAALPMQLTAAAAAGVKRVFLLLSDALADAAALDTQLAASGLEYTVMRTGPLVAGPGGSGLKLAELDMPVCDEVPREGKRTRTTPSTLNARARFFLHPFSHTTLSIPLPTNRRLPLRDRGDHPPRGQQALLLPLPVPRRRVDPQADAPRRLRAPRGGPAAPPGRRQGAGRRAGGGRDDRGAAGARPPLGGRGCRRARGRAQDAPCARKRRGIETQERLAFEEKEKAAKREEMAKYYSTPGDDSETPGPRGEGSSDAAPVEGGEEEDKPEETPDAPPAA